MDRLTTNYFYYLVTLAPVMVTQGESILIVLTAIIVVLTTIPLYLKYRNKAKLKIELFIHQRAHAGEPQKLVTLRVRNCGRGLARAVYCSTKINETQDFYPLNWADIVPAGIRSQSDRVDIGSREFKEALFVILGAQIGRLATDITYLYLDYGKTYVIEVIIKATNHKPMYRRYGLKLNSYDDIKFIELQS